MSTRSWSWVVVDSQDLPTDSPRSRPSPFGLVPPPGPSSHTAIDPTSFDSLPRCPLLAQYGKTALIAAAYSGRDRVVDLLVKAGADLTLENSVGTALANAKQTNHAKCVAILEVGCHLQSIGGLLQEDDDFNDLFPAHKSFATVLLLHSKCVRVRLHTTPHTHTHTCSHARTNTQAAKAVEAKSKAEKEADKAKAKAEKDAANSAAAEKQTTEEKAAKEAAAEAKALADKAAAEKAEAEKYAAEEAAKKQVCVYVCEEREWVRELVSGWMGGEKVISPVSRYKKSG